MYEPLQTMKIQILRLMSLFCEQCQKYRKSCPVSPGLNTVLVKILMWTKRNKIREQS